MEALAARGDWDVTVINPIGVPPVAMGRYKPLAAAAVTAVERPALLVEEGKALVRSEPRADAAVVADVPAGSEVEIVDGLPGWTKIRLADGGSGWVAASAVFDLSR